MAIKKEIKENYLKVTSGKLPHDWELNIVSAVKNAEDGNGFIIRVFNPTKEDKQIRVEIPGKRIRTQLCDFLECSQTELTETFDEAQYMLGCNKVCTIRVITE